MPLTTPKIKMFSVRDGILKVALADVWALKLHEKVLPDFIKKLEAFIKEDGIVKDPVIVDEKTLVVLDGMHRVVALRELGSSYVPCCFIDYTVPVVQLGAWYRVIIGGASTKEIVEMTRTSFKNLRINEAETTNLDRKINSFQGIGAFRSSSSAWIIRTGKKTNPKEAYDSIYLIEEKLRSSGLRITFQTESDAKTIILNDKSSTCLMVPVLSKKDVLHFALRGEVFAPKATRHVFPVRILGVNIPVEWLDGEKLEITEANEKLQSLLSSRKLVKLPGGQIVDGRRYEEPIYLFEN